MIAIPRCLARQFRAVLRRCGLSRGYENLPITLRSGREGLTMFAAGNSVHVEYRQPGEFGAGELVVGAELLAMVEGRKPDLVTLQARPGNKVLASWSDRGIPQRVELPVPCRKGTLTVLPEPEAIAGNEGRLWQALGDAVAASSNEAVRYALNCVQLCGSDGTMVATDGHELLRQSGFTWPWDNEVLIPALVPCHSLILG